MFQTVILNNMLPDNNQEEQEFHSEGHLHGESYFDDPIKADFHAGE